jgi:murein DD-endopeptidase MepM/ murein hydrolase activator NlpD
VRQKLSFRPFAAASISILTALVLALACAGIAVAATGGAPTPGSSPPPPASGSGTAAAEPSAGNLTLLAAEATPKRSFYFGYRSPTLKFTLGSDQPLNDIRIDVVNSTTKEVIRTFYREDVPPDAPQSVYWDGANGENRPARNGKYTFRVSPQTPAPAARRATASTAIDPGFSFFGYTFPILGAHEYSLSAGRFGAGRSGHTHQGQDVFAPCGTPLLAARGGKVQFSGFHSAAGNYIVIDGRGTPYDFMYAHLAVPSPRQTGETVRTGQPIGVVGDTGSASGCHLHFEMWGAPGWYEGGSPFDPLLYLQEWDKYS